MSLIKLFRPRYQLCCDNCNIMDFYTNKGIAEYKSKKEGWRWCNHKKEHYCPRCARRLKYSKKKGYWVEDNLK